jgi:hypothetical protein
MRHKSVFQVSRAVTHKSVPNGASHLTRSQARLRRNRNVGARSRRALKGTQSLDLARDPEPIERASLRPYGINPPRRIGKPCRKKKV